MSRYKGPHSWTPGQDYVGRIIAVVVLGWILCYISSSISSIEEGERFVQSSIKWGLAILAGIAVLGTIYFVLNHVRSKTQPSKHTNLPRFNELFVQANNVLMGGNTESLKSGLGHLIEALKVSGPYSRDLKKAISHLYAALDHHDRADTKGPWNWDLSGYGLNSWRNDLIDSDTALQRAWPHIEKINTSLLEQGLGWRHDL